MITKQDLDEAIAECQGTRYPNANTCVKLAAYYIIYDHLMEADQQGTKRGESMPVYSYASEPPAQDGIIEYDSKTAFAEAIQGRKINDVLPIIDELMTVLEAVNPRLHAGVMRKIEG